MLSAAWPSAANTPESSSAIINMVSPSGTKDIPLPFTTTQTLNVHVRSYTAVSFTSAAMHSVSQFVKTPQVTTALISTTETSVKPTFASTVKPTITSSVNGKYVVITEWLQLHRHVQLSNSNSCQIKIQLILRLGLASYIINSEIHSRLVLFTLTVHGKLVADYFNIL